MGEIKEQWHPPFYCSYEIDFRKYKDMLQIDTGYILERSSEIDILTVKKKKDAVIDNGLGSIYREHNIIEYKSPDDRIDMSAWLQAMGYAFLYMRLENIKSFKSILVSLMGYNYPRKLIKELKDLGYTEEQVEEGILFFTNPINIDVQIVIINRIDTKKYPWITLIQKEHSNEQLEERLAKVSNEISHVKNMEEYRERILEVIRFITKQYDDKKKGKEAIKKMDVIEELINEKIEEKDKEIESWKEQAQKNARRAEAAEAIIEQLKSRGVSIDGEQVAL
jgi:hypothetical protein